MLALVSLSSLALRATIRMSGAAPYPYSLVTVHPTYEINDPSAVEQIMQAYVTQSKAEACLCYCGFSTTRSAPDSSVVGDFSATVGDRLAVREAYPDGAAVLAHLSNVAKLREELRAGPATLTDLQLHGPAAALRECRGAVVDILSSASFWEIESGLSRIEKEAGGMPLPLVLTSLQSTFRVADADAARSVCDEAVKRSQTEEGCLYHGWTRCGDLLVCREAFGSASGLARHAENIRECMDALTAGPASLEASELHASVGQLKVFDEFVADTARERGYCSRETPRFVAADSGYSRYEFQQSMFGFFFRR